MERLSRLFEPERVAVVGATDREGSIGRAIMENLLEAFTGEVVPVNPSRTTVMGIDCHASVAEVEARVDLAIVVVPARAVADVVEEAATAGVTDFVVISGGFAEVGEAGRRRQDALAAIAAEHDLNLVGPNSLGIINTANGLNATFATQGALEGSISMMSQSGAFITAVLDWAIEREIGFRHVVSLGNEAVLEEGDFVTAWSDDPATDVILGYVEDIAEGGRFIDTASAVTQHTPIVMLKAGRSAAGARAVASHTGSLAGADEAYDAAFRQAGIIRADTIQEFFDYARALADQPPLETDAIAILSNAGGPAVLAADAVDMGPLELARFSEETTRRLGDALPEEATVTNPLDIIGDADLGRFEATIRTLLEDDGVGGIVVMACPTALFDHDDLADLIGALTREYPHPVITCLMGGAAATAASRRLDAYGIANYFDPARAVDSMAVLDRYRRIRERPTESPRAFDVDTARAEAVIQEAMDAGRTQLGPEAMEILAAYGIEIPDGEVVTSPGEAREVADELGDAVVMKIVSPDIVHKTDIGGVRVGVDRADVADTYGQLMALATDHDPDASILGIQIQELVDVEAGVETIAGMTRDEQFGPVVMFGLGGIFVEVLEDVAFRIAPFGARDARAMTEEIHSAPMLRGARGRRPVDIDAVVDLLQRLSQLVVDVPAIAELDINPLLASHTGAVAVDFRATIDAE